MSLHWTLKQMASAGYFLGDAHPANDPPSAVSHAVPVTSRYDWSSYVSRRGFKIATSARTTEANWYEKKLTVSGMTGTGLNFYCDAQFVKLFCASRDALNVL